MMSRKETRDLLISMKDKGYSKIGVLFQSHRTLNILLIHKDWQKFDLHKQLRQAMNDTPTKIKTEYMVSYEIPTRHMYDNDRKEDAPKHKILVDLGPYKQKSLWQRKGLFYYATLQIYNGQTRVGTVTKKLDFLSYHLIKRFHGVKGLNDMAMKTAMNRMFNS